MHFFTCFELTIQCFVLPLATEFLKSLVTLRGLTGSFPAMVSLIRGAAGFVPGAPIPLQELRLNLTRQSRDNVIDL